MLGHVWDQLVDHASKAMVKIAGWRLAGIKQRCGKYGPTKAWYWIENDDVISTQMNWDKLFLISTDFYLPPLARLSHLVQLPPIPLSFRGGKHLTAICLGLGVESEGNIKCGWQEHWIDDHYDS